MAIIHDATVTGVGDEIWSSDYNPVTMRAVVINPGSGIPLDSTLASRYIRFGWWAPIENFVSDADYGTAICLLEPAFLFALFQKTLLDPGIAAYGIDGFHYDLQAGVEVRFVWHS